MGVAHIPHVVGPYNFFGITGDPIRHNSEGIVLLQVFSPVKPLYIVLIFNNYNERALFKF